MDQRSPVGADGAGYRARLPAAVAALLERARLGIGAGISPRRAEESACGGGESRARIARPHDNTAIVAVRGSPTAAIIHGRRFRFGARSPRIGVAMMIRPRRIGDGLIGFGTTGHVAKYASGVGRLARGDANR